MLTLTWSINYLKHFVAVLYFVKRFLLVPLHEKGGVTPIILYYILVCLYHIGILPSPKLL